jgi:NhaP-type Na+/H+ or K+/H+ antiporter
LTDISFPGFLVLVMLLGVTAQWIAWRIKVPSILLLLLFGLALGFWTTPDAVLNRLAGTDDDFATRILLPLVSLSVAVILFEGGLTLRWGQLAGQFNAVMRLIAFSSVITWILTAVIAHYLLGLSWSVAWLLGAILMVTGPTVVGPLLRQIRPNRRLTSILQWEGILIDPVGAIAAVLVFDVIGHAGQASVISMFGMVLQTFLIGMAIGLVFAAFLVLVIRNYWLPDFLDGVFFLVVALIAFAISNQLRDESGLVAVTVMGIALANQKLVSVEHVLAFKENLRVLLIGSLFIVLGSRLRLGDLADIGWAGIPFLLLLIFVVRPISVWIGTIGCKLPTKERLFLGAVAPRGIVAASVASVFGLKLATLGAGVDVDPTWLMEAKMLTPITFLVILGTVAFCGLGAGPLARRLGLSDPDPQGILFVGAQAWVRDLAVVLTKFNIPVLILDANYSNFSAARMAGLNAHCVNALSEHIQESLELSGIGRVFAVTPNDEVNTLVVHEYLRFFSRSSMYQLPYQGKTSARWQTLSESRRGRALFDSRATNSSLSQILRDGGTIKATTLSSAFMMADFYKQHGEDAIVMMGVGVDGRLKIRTTQGNFLLQPGDSVIALVPAKQNVSKMEEPVQETTSS